jgi:hypothetical protein
VLFLCKINFTICTLIFRKRAESDAIFFIQICAVSNTNFLAAIAAVL